MEREIKFRGKDKDGKWHYGVPISTHVGTYIVEEENPHVCSLYGYMEIDELSLVESETIGQYTGMKDINGKEIFEGDILTDKLVPVPFEVKWWKDACAFCVFANGDGVPLAWFSEYDVHNATIIGNIHDNPELVEKVYQELKEKENQK